MTQRVPDHGEQHPEEWRKDLNPEANKGRNWDEAGNDPEQNAPSALDFKLLRRQLKDFSEEELREINVLTEAGRDLRRPLRPRPRRVYGQRSHGGGARPPGHPQEQHALLALESPDRRPEPRAAERAGLGAAVSGF
jgi:hypothetical protein